MSGNLVKAIFGQFHYLLYKTFEKHKLYFLEWLIDVEHDIGKHLLHLDFPERTTDFQC